MFSEPRWYIENPNGHTWQQTDEGDVDVVAVSDNDFHNGPKCVACGYFFCEHCAKEGSLPPCPNPS